MAEISKRRLRRWLGASTVLLVALAALPSSLSARQTPRLPGRLIARARAGLSTGALQSALRHNGARSVRAVDALAATVIAAPDAELSAVEAALRRSGLFKSVERDYLAGVADDPDDPYFADQWGLPRCGVPAAWALSTGAGVVVAVIDTGIEATHPDLLGQVLPGYDFVNDDADPSDDHGHGTRMSGIIAAHRNNDQGIAGIAPDAMLLPVKVLDAQGSGAYSAVASGITYAVDHGARVLNLSLTGPVQSDLLQAAVDYATAHGVVVVAAAGNEGTNSPVYPAAATGTVAVSAVDANDQQASFSNYGAWISIAAPGVDIVTTSLDATYASSTGTSPAAAFGSGVFALLLAAEPTLSRADAISRVQAGAADLGSRGWDRFFGWGRTDAYATLVPGQHGAAPPDAVPPDVSILSPAKNSLMSGMVPIDVAANDNVAVERVELFIDEQHYATATDAPYQFVIDAAQFAPGAHTLEANAYDSSQNFAHSKPRKIYFTTGSGLLVDHAVATATRLSIVADFALPEGTTFDPGRDGLSITLTAADGTILSATAEAGSLSGASSAKLQGTITPAVPTTGRIRLTTAANGQQPVYRMKIRGSRLTAMTDAQPLMNLGVQLGGVQLSQSLSFRSKGAALIYP